MAQHGLYCKLSLKDIFAMLKHALATSDSVNGGVLLFRDGVISAKFCENKPPQKFLN